MNWIQFIENIHKRVNGYLDHYKIETDRSELWEIHIKLLEIETILNILKTQAYSRTDIKLKKKLSKLWYNISLERHLAEKANPLF